MTTLAAQTALFEETGWYVLESFVPGNPKHKPKYQVVDHATARRVVVQRKKNVILKSITKRSWRVVSPAQDSKEGAREYLSIHRGLRALEHPELFSTKLPAPVVRLTCGCVVSSDKRREKRCSRLQELEKEARNLWPAALSEDRALQSLNQYHTNVTFHLWEARAELSALETDVR